MASAAIAPSMSGNARAAMEHLDRARGDADIDLLADQGVRHRIAETRDLDVIVQADAGQLPLGKDIFGGRQPTSSGRSIASNSWCRLMPRRRIGHSFICISTSRIAALHSASEKKLHSASEKKVTWRRRPRISGLGKPHPGLDPRLRDVKLLACRAVCAVGLGECRSRNALSCARNFDSPPGRRTTACGCPL
jgi:hypothetical protein